MAATENPDVLTVSKRNAERGVFVAIVAAVVGYFNLGVSVVDNENETPPAIVIDDKEFVKNAAEAINSAHNEISALKVRTSALERRVGMPINPLSPLPPQGATGSAVIGAKGDTEAKPKQ